MGMKLYVGNLSFEASESDLRDLFAQAGQVESAKIITDMYTSRSRGFGFVEMANRDEGQKAIDQFNGKELKGRPIVVNEAKPQERRPGGGGAEAEAGGRLPASDAQLPWRPRPVCHRPSPVNGSRPGASLKR